MTNHEMRMDIGCDSSCDYSSLVLSNLDIIRSVTIGINTYQILPEWMMSVGIQK